MDIYLVADIGGTSSRIILYKKNKIFLRKTFRTSSGILKKIKDYLSLGRIKKLDAICICAAGPKVNGSIHMSNKDVTISKDDFSTYTDKIFILNDFEAQAYYLIDYKEKDVLTLQGEQHRRGRFGILGVGTGLGYAALEIKEEGGLNIEVYPEELSNEKVEFITDKDMELKNFLKEEYAIKTPIKEDILSGRGLERLYHYLHGEKKGAEEIMNHPNHEARKAFNLLTSYLARVIAEKSVEANLSQGVFLSGGVIIKNIDKLDTERFIAELRKNDEAQDLPVHLITNEDVGLIGCKNYIRKISS